MSINISSNGFENIIVNRSIPPHETVRGWAFFDIPESLTTETLFRMHIRNTAGQETTSMLTRPSETNPEDQIQEQPIQTKAVYDLRQFPKSFYTEPKKTEQVK
jgi:hypothetical protein